VVNQLEIDKIASKNKTALKVNQDEPMIKNSDNPRKLFVSNKINKSIQIKEDEHN
jgi:hypothetical protein